MHRAVVVGGETTGSDGGHCMGKSNTEIDTAHHKNSRCYDGEDQIDLKERDGHLMQARHDTVECRTAALGTVHIDRACPGLREQRDKDHDDAEAADPRRHHPPEEDAVRHPIECDKDRRARTGKARDTLKECVEKTEVVAEEVGKHPEKSPREPAERCNGDPLARGQIVGGAPVTAKGDAEKDADEDGQHERLAACLLADDGEDKGNRECRRHRKGKA